MANNNSFVWILVVLGILLGGLFSYIVFPREVVKEVKGDTINVPGPVEYVNQTVYVNQTTGSITVDSTGLLTQAENDAWDRELSDNEAFLTCGNTNYDPSDVTLSRATEWGYHWINKRSYDIAYSAKYTYDSTNDNDRCSVIRQIVVHYVDGDLPKVNWK